MCVLIRAVKVSRKSVPDPTQSPVDRELDDPLRELSI
jgi:hypothetical protein